MTKDEIEHKAYLFFREKGLEYVDNIDELIEYCRDFAYPFISYFEEKIADLEKQVKDLKETNAILSESTAINQKDLEYKVSVIEQRNKRIAELKKENAELKKRVDNLYNSDCWASDQLTEAKEIILKLYNAGRDVLMCRAEEKAYDNLDNAINDGSIEQFLKEIEK